MLLGAIAGRPKRTDLATELVQAIQQGRLCIVDLTYDLDEKSPFWPDGSASSPFHATTVATYENDVYFARHPSNSRALRTTWMPRSMSNPGAQA